EERLVQPGSSRVLAEEVAVERHRLRAGCLRRRPFALGSGRILLGFRRGPDAERQAARAEEIRQPGGHLCLLRLAAAQGEQAAERALLLLLLCRNGRIGATVEERRIPPGLGERLGALLPRGRDRGDGCGDEGGGKGDHGGLLPRPASGGRTAPLPSPHGATFGPVPGTSRS